MLVTNAVTKFAENAAAGISMEAPSPDYSSALFTVVGSDDDRSVYTFRASTPYLCGVVMEEIANLDARLQATFCQRALTLLQIRGTWGYMFEKYFHVWVNSVDRNAKGLVCTARSKEASKSSNNAPASSTKTPSLYKRPKLESRLETLKSVGRRNVYISGVSNLKNVNKWPIPFCWLPSSPTTASFNAVICTDDHIITIHLTVASDHRMSEKGFLDLDKHLPDNFKQSRTWSHVFVIDCELHAIWLRRPDRDIATERNISIYSVVLNVPECQFSFNDVKNTLKPGTSHYADLWHLPRGYQDEPEPVAMEED
jgi:hypothetical protein